MRPRAVGAELFRRTRGRYLSPLASLVLFAVLFVAVIASYEFASPAQVFLNLLVDNAYLIVLAVGMTFVILTGGIDLSVGAVVALSTVILATALRAGWPMPLAVAVVLVAGPTLGLMMGLVIEYFDVQPFIATLAGMFLARGLCYVLSVDSLPIRDPALRAFGLDYVYPTTTNSSGGASSSRSPPWWSVRTCCTRPVSAARCTHSVATGSRHS